MKKRILLLVPCILLLLGLLTACSGNGGQTSQTAEEKLTNTTWTGEVEDASGLIDINLPFDMGKLITIRFNADKTGYIQILNKTQNFTWDARGSQITIKSTAFKTRTLNFHLDGDSLVLRGTGININLKH